MPAAARRWVRRETLRAERNAAERPDRRQGQGGRGSARSRGGGVARAVHAARRQDQRARGRRRGLRIPARQICCCGSPTPPDPDVPVGPPEASVIVRSWGEPAPHDGRKPHWEIAEALGMIDLAAGAKVAGSGFPIYRGAGAALQRALIDFFLDLHTREHGFTEIWPPALVNEASARGTGQIPDKEDQMYVVTRDDLYLVPTAEVPVTNIHRDEIIEADQLPIRYVAYSPCFRREAGAAGAKTRGILRVHQFDKVEMVCFERPDDSQRPLEWLTERAEVCLQRLGLPYRVKLHGDGRHGLHAGQEVRPRGLGARRAGLAGGQLGLELPRLPGPPHEHPLAARAGRQAGDPAHAQWLGAGPAAHRRRDPRGLPAAGRLGGGARGAARPARRATDAGLSGMAGH